MLISGQNLSLSYGDIRVLSHVDLTISRGEITTIVGPNGSGKSSLLKLVTGAVTAQSGTIERADNLRIGYVPQRLHIDPTLPLSVERFLHLPVRVGSDVAKDAMRTAGVEHLASRQMSNLSGGQFQRVLLARALLNRPNLLILDEATQGLDQPGSAAFYQRIEKVRRELDCAVLMVSHELHVVMAASDHVVCLNGHVCCQGAPEQVASAPEYRALFGSGTQGALALYRHDHNHEHDHDHAHGTQA
jgi:zinc transport system ATP-binding protein